MKTLKNVALAVLTGLLLYQCNTPSQKGEQQAAKQQDEPDSVTLQAMKTYEQYCSSCHGEQMMAFADRKWKHGKEADSIYHSIVNGYPDAGMPAWGSALSEGEIRNLVTYIIKGIENVERYGFQEETLESDTFQTEKITLSLDTINNDIREPWGMAFLPSGDLLVTDKSGGFYRIDKNKRKVAIQGAPAVKYKGQGGLLDVELHPDFAQNKWVYLSYSDFRVEKGDTLSGTAVSRYVFENDRLTQEKTILKAEPYSGKRHHYGSRLEFDQDGYLFVTVGDRGNRDENPQSLASHCGKVHRVGDDGSIPSDNPFVNQSGAVASVYSYGHRNPQGMIMEPNTGKIWSHEHGPRGGDEVNVIQKGINYGWPTISYGINYDGTTFTDKLEAEGMEQPILYWVPSIAPSGMAFVSGSVYPEWEGDLLVGSLRFKYLNRCTVKEGKIVAEEIMLKNIGRVRNVKTSPDGYIYVAVEKPGFIFRLEPLK